MSVLKPNKEYPLEALRDCMFCGNDRKNIKILGNALTEIGNGLEVCDRFCPNCLAKAPIRMWDGTDSNCSASTETSDKDLYRKIDEWNALKKSILTLLDATFESKFGKSRQQLTDEIMTNDWIAILVSDNTFLTVGLSKKGPCEFLLKLPASLSDADAVNSLVDTLRSYVKDLDVFESIQADSLTFVDQHKHRHTASVHESTSVEITSLVVKYLNYLPINPKVLSVKINP